MWDVMQQCVYKPKIHDTDDLLKHLMQTWLDFEQAVINATIDVHPSEIMFPVSVICMRSKVKGQPATKTHL